MIAFSLRMLGSFALCLAMLACDGGPSNLTGRWEGTAQVEGIEYLKTGSFPVVLHLVHRGDRVRGVLDVNQEAGFMAEWFGYYLEGTVSGDRLSIELTDRSCGAGDPQALCAPQWGASKVKVFEADLQVGEFATLSASECRVKDGITYTDDVPIEAPFTALSVSLTEGEIQSAPVPFAGKWKGPFNPPFSVVYAGIRMFGTNKITFEGNEEEGYAMTRFDNNKTNIYPTHDDIILADTFRYDASSKRFWFVEAGTVYGTWLWIGEVMGDTIAGHFLSDPIDQRIWNEDTAPVDPFAVPFENFEATFILKKQRLR